MNTFLAYARGQTFFDDGLGNEEPTEEKIQMIVPFMPTHAVIKTVAYKARTTVVADADPTISNIEISEADATSGLLFLHCSLWPGSPIAIINTPSTLICPDTIIPLMSTSVQGNVTFSVRTMGGRLSDVKGEFAVLLEFHS